MELLTGGELFYRIRTHTSFSEKEASQLMKKLVSAVNFMHSNDLCHRDLKPENLLFSSSAPDAEIKIIDFGFAKKRMKHQTMTTPCGTLLYTAPEVLRTATSFNYSQSSSLSKSSVSSSPSSSTSTTVAFVPSITINTNAIAYGYDESCDLWSLGVILYTMLSGEVPFNSITAHRTAEDIVEDISRSQLSYDTPAWKNVSQGAKDLVKGTFLLLLRLLTVDPSKRLTIKDLSRNAWLRGSSIPISNEHLMTPSILCQASRSLIVRAVNVTMRAFQKAGQFQLSSVTDGLLAQRRYAKKSTDSCSSTSSSTTTSTTAVVPTNYISSSTLPHTRRLCGNGVCRCRHAPCPPTNDILSLSSFDFSEERLSQLIDQYPLTTTTITPKRYGMTLRSRATATTNGIHHEFASPAPPPPLLLVPSLSVSSSSSSSSSLSSIATDILPSTNTNSEKRPLTSPIYHPLASANKKVKRSGTITIND
ncbi:unnamed protein product [Rotaria sp. Silwood2]|nr:unnamed protein product [Rotaria sp. Silwood2]CAF2722987.1 unnamed protein product [Rotaria sp. Silwood2]CAF2941339.1 unnamed protein product [Rotaria sp. Silwood2]CAF3090215.1 unnamed protein product [Rotaria sp. Silwood2]CAF4269266.1 unnamed protein product [Rotaria sp. Silwood2]